MSSLLIFPTLLPGTLPTLLPGTLLASLPSQRSVAFTKHWDLVLKFLGLNIEVYMIIHQVKTIWISEKPFTLYRNTWRWIYGIANIVMHSVCAIDLVAKKIRLLNALAKFLEEISNMLKKDFVYLGLNKKSTKKLRASLDRYIKAVSFIIYFRCFSYHKLLNLVNKVK